MGHGLGHYKIHTDPPIPNYDDGSKGLIKPGMTFAIEPFATDGKGLIFETGVPTIFLLTSPKLSLQWQLGRYYQKLKLWRITLFYS